MARRDAVRFVSLFAPPDVAAESTDWRPSADVYRTRDGWLLKFDLAGVRPEDVRLTVQGSTITVGGSRRDCCLEEGCSQYRMEISYSHFERRIDLPADLSRSRLTTEFRDGMLIVRARAADEGAGR
jgi:HSP20 family protein